MVKNWTENKVFYLTDRRLGEERLATSRIFFIDSLSLCCDVPLSALEDVNDPTPWAESCDTQHIDYLVCRGDDAVMAIEVDERDDWLGPPAHVEGLHFEEVSARQMARGNMDEVVQRVETILSQEFRPRWKCRLREPPEQLVPRLAGKRLVERRESVMSPPKTFTVPSAYGTDAGIVRVYLTDDVYDTFQCVPMYSERTAAQLERLLAVTVSAQPYRAQIPFDERLSRQRSGLPCNDCHSANFIRSLAGTPIREYLRDFPAELKELKDVISFDDFDEITYGELAEAIGGMLQEAVTHRYGITMMRLLATPILKQFERGQKRA